MKTLGFRAQYYEDVVQRGKRLTIRVWSPEYAALWKAGDKCQMIFGRRNNPVGRIIGRIILIDVVDISAELKAFSTSDGLEVTAPERLLTALADEGITANTAVTEALTGIYSDALDRGSEFVYIIVFTPEVDI